MRKTIVYMVFTVFFLMNAPVHAKPEIKWLIWDLPPEFIKSGPWANQGYADKFLKDFIAHLSEYDHKIQRVNVPRWSTEVLKPQRCSAHLWGGFFPNQIRLSKAYTFTPPHVAIFHRRHEKRIGPPGSVVSLQDLLKQEDLKLATMRLEFNNDAGQSRYPVLYPYLKPYQGKKNYIEYSAGRNLVELRLLDGRRADYTIGYPTTITTQQRTAGVGDDYVSYQLKEHNLYKKVYVSCNNDVFGNEVIEKLNQFLTKDRLKQFLAYHEEWNGENSEFRETYLDYFIHEKPLENVID